MGQARREFRNVIRSQAVDEAKPVDEYLAEVVVTAGVQRRCRQAIQHTILTNEWRTHAMNRWLE